MSTQPTDRPRPSLLARIGSPAGMLITGLLLIAAGVLAAINPFGGVAGSTAQTGLHDAAPDFSLPAPEAGTLALSSYRGRYVLVNFWATWCPPCRAELPDLAAYYADHADEGFMLIGVNAQEPAATVSRYLAGQRLDFPVALDADGAVMARYRVAGLPSSFLIDPAGRIVQRWTGMISRATLERAVTPRLGGPG